jgi:hypothetical protein
MFRVRQGLRVFPAMADPIDWSKLRQRAIELVPLDRSSELRRVLVGLTGALIFFGCALAAVLKEHSAYTVPSLKPVPAYSPTVECFPVRRVKVVPLAVEAAANAKASSSGAGAHGVGWSVRYVAPGTMIDASACAAAPT